MSQPRCGGNAGAAMDRLVRIRMHGLWLNLIPQLLKKAEGQVGHRRAAQHSDIAVYYNQVTVLFCTDAPMAICSFIVQCGPRPQ